MKKDNGKRTPPHGDSLMGRKGIPPIVDVSEVGSDLHQQSLVVLPPSVREAPPAVKPIGETDPDGVARLTIDVEEPDSTPTPDDKPTDT